MLAYLLLASIHFANSIIAFSLTMLTGDFKPTFYIIDCESILLNLEKFYGSSIGSKRETINYGSLKLFKDNWHILDKI